MPSSLGDPPVQVLQCIVDVVVVVVVLVVAASLHWSMIATIISGSSSCKSLQVSFPTIS